MKKEITVQELIDQLNQIENKNMPNSLFFMAQNGEFSAIVQCVSVTL